MSRRAPIAAKSWLRGTNVKFVESVEVRGRPEEDRLTVGLVSLEADPPRLDLRDQILTEASFLFWEAVEFLNSFENDANRVERINGGGICLMIVAEDRGHVIDTLTADGTKQRASATAPPWFGVPQLRRVGRAATGAARFRPVVVSSADAGPH